MCGLCGDPFEDVVECHECVVAKNLSEGQLIQELLDLVCCQQGEVVLKKDAKVIKLNQAKDKH